MLFDIRRYNEVTSTNTMCREWAAQGEKEGVVILADYQTEGRGKPGNVWESPRGKNLLFSILLRPKMAVNQSPIFTQIACRAVASVLKEKYGLKPAFKRPNDVLVDGKKICGVLVETSSAGNRLDAVIVGIGLNVNAARKELFPGSTSICEETGKLIDRQILLDQILDRFNQDLDRPLTPGSTGF